MFRLKKLLWILIVLWIVFFIICDEKWIEIEWDKDHIVLHQTEKSKISKNEKLIVQYDPNAVYKNSDLIYLNYEFENPRNLRKADWMDPEYLAKVKEEKRLEEERIRNLEKPGIVSLGDNNTISSVFQWKETQDNTWTVKPEVKQNTWTMKPEIKQNTWTVKTEVKQNTWTVKPEVKQNTWTEELKIEQDDWINTRPKQNFWTEKTDVKQDTWVVKQEVNQNTWEKKETTSKVEPEKQEVSYPVEKYEHDNISLNLSKWEDLRDEEYQWVENIILYKNSNRIKLYAWFENPRNMRRSAWIDEEFLAKQEDEESSDVSLDDWNVIDSNVSQNNSENIDNIQNIEIIENVQDTWYIENIQLDDKNDIEWNDNQESSVDSQLIIESEWESEIETWVEVEVWAEVETWESVEINKLEEPEERLISIDKPEISRHSINISEWKSPEVVLVKVEKYKSTKHKLNLRKWKKIKHNFVLENTENVQQTQISIPDSLLESLLENEEINIDTLESENDEFLQKVFEKTRDRDVMNLIVETYLNEYQFVKAKRFIENLPEMYREELKPSLNLRVAFNSFALSSKNISENLNSILQDYSSKGLILDEDKNRYLWVLALMDRNYDKFFEISEWFTSEKHKAFTSKLQWYKDQIAKQMWMPDYYFDTLVSLELFNQWLFQPAKVLALYSLQQNSSYILPYQVLAYANFLTNSWDTSVEYLKKLVDLDPNNAEKYRFLMWVAYYRDEKYEQSVVMLSMIKDEKLRLDTQRYLINDYLKLDQKNKLILNRNKMLWHENLVASDFYTYFYETFFHPYSQWEEFQLYAFDTELANKMLRVCSITLKDEEKAVCTYGTIGRNIALWQFDGMEQYLLKLVAEYPQWYLYQALWEYYVQHEELDKAKAYLLKAVSLTQKRAEINQIKKLLQETM